MNEFETELKMMTDRVMKLEAVVFGNQDLHLVGLLDRISSIEHTLERMLKQMEQFGVTDTKMGDILVELQSWVKDQQKAALDLKIERKKEAEKIALWSAAIPSLFIAIIEMVRTIY